MQQRTSSYPLEIPAGQSHVAYSGPRIVSPSKQSSCTSTVEDGCYRTRSHKTPPSNSSPTRITCSASPSAYRLAPEDPFPGRRARLLRRRRVAHRARPVQVRRTASICRRRERRRQPVRPRGNPPPPVAKHQILLLQTQRPAPPLRRLRPHVPSVKLDLRPLPRPSSSDRDLMEHYLAVYLPDTTAEQRKDPAMSPLYADLAKLSLPPALFTCGTSDPLLDDTMFHEHALDDGWGRGRCENIPRSPPWVYHVPAGGVQRGEGRARGG